MRKVYSVKMNGDSIFEFAIMNPDIRSFEELCTMYSESEEYARLCAQSNADINVERQNVNLGRVRYSLNTVNIERFQGIIEDKCGIDFFENHESAKDFLNRLFKSRRTIAADIKGKRLDTTKEHDIELKEQNVGNQTEDADTTKSTVENSENIRKNRIWERTRRLLDLIQRDPAVGKTYFSFPAKMQVILLFIHYREEAEVIERINMYNSLRSGVQVPKKKKGKARIPTKFSVDTVLNGLPLYSEEDIRVFFVKEWGDALLSPKYVKRTQFLLMKKKHEVMRSVQGWFEEECPDPRIEEGWHQMSSLVIDCQSSAVQLTSEAEVETLQTLEAEAETTQISEAEAETPQTLEAEVETTQISEAEVEIPQTLEAEAETTQISEAEVETPQTLEAEVETTQISEAEVEIPQTSEAEAGLLRASKIPQISGHHVVKKMQGPVIEWCFATSMAEDSRSVLIDTNILMDIDTQRNVLISLEKRFEHGYISRIVYNELLKHSQGTNPEKKRQADMAIRYLAAKTHPTSKFYVKLNDVAWNMSGDADLKLIQQAKKFNLTIVTRDAGAAVMSRSMGVPSRYLRLRYAGETMPAIKYSGKRRIAVLDIDVWNSARIGSLELWLKDKFSGCVITSEYAKFLNDKKYRLRDEFFNQLQHFLVAVACDTQGFFMYANFITDSKNQRDYQDELLEFCKARSLTLVTADPKFKLEAWFSDVDAVYMP